MIFLFVLMSVSLVALGVFLFLHVKYNISLYGICLSLLVYSLSVFLMAVLSVVAKFNVSKTIEQYDYLSQLDDLENRPFELANYNESVARMKSGIEDMKNFSIYFFEKENVLKLEYL